MSVTGATHQVQTVVDILQNATSYTVEPDIRKHWDDRPSEMGPGADQPPVVYVWSPVSSDIPQFSSDGDLFDRTSTVEIQVWSLSEDDTITVQDDVVGILSEYFADNNTQTSFVDIRPTNTTDFRQQTHIGETDHYIATIEADLRTLDETNLA